jgi:glutaredoxin
MFANLKQVIVNKTPGKPFFDKNVKYFMYAKQGCGYSKRAYREISGRLKDPTRFTIVDPLKKGYLCSATWELKTKDHEDVNAEEKKQLEELVSLWDGTRTYPDIYVHDHPQWKWIGGCDDLERALMTLSNPGSDLLRSLRWGKVDVSNPSSSLRF